MLFNSKGFITTGLDTSARKRFVSDVNAPPLMKSIRSFSSGSYSLT